VFYLIFELLIGLMEKPQIHSIGGWLTIVGGKIRRIWSQEKVLTVQQATVGAEDPP
jgi:hypothetical protein